MSSILGIVSSSRRGASSSYESLATFTGNGSSSTVTFSSIPSTYVSLQVRINALFSSAGNGISIRPNASSATNYTRHRLSGDGASVSADGTATGSLTGADVFAHLVGGSTTQPAVVIVDLHNYASSTQNKTIRSIAGCDKNGSGEINLMSSLWNQTTAVSSLQVYSGTNFATGTTISLYGIKGA